jgi:hypothetical protein
MPYNNAVETVSVGDRSSSWRYLVRIVDVAETLRLVVDVHVDCVVERLVGAGVGVVDQRDHAVRRQWLVTTGGELDPEGVDERAVLLVADLPVVEDLCVQSVVGGDRPERDRCRDRVRIGVVVEDDRQRPLRLAEDLDELLGLVGEFARLQRTECGVRDHLVWVDHHVCTQLDELVLAHRIVRPDDDVLFAPRVPDRLDGRLVRVDVAREDQHDLLVGDRLGNVRLCDVLLTRVQILVAQRLDPVLVSVEDHNVLAGLCEVVGDRVADAPTAQYRVGGHRRHRDACAHTVSCGPRSHLKPPVATACVRSLSDRRRL